MTETSYDPVTFEIIQNSLSAISDEMFVAMRNTAMSAIIYEVLDMGTGITDAVGGIASSGAGIPSFVGVLDKAVKAILRKHKVETIKPGDLYATNDPFYGGVTHLNDVILAMPVFADGVLVAWTANIAHWNDIGGMVPGGMSTEATQLFQEGLRLPAIKLIDQGVPNDALMDVMATNSRLPDFLRGDMWAGIAAARLGEKRLKEIAVKYGTETVLAAIRHYMDFGEQRTLAGIRNLPKGKFSMTEEQDSGLFYNVTIEITDDKFIVDLRDNPKQVAGPMNASHDGMLISAQMALKAVTDSSLVTNDGSFRPLEVLTKEGTVFHATEPAAHGFYFEVEIRVYDLILRCLAAAMPERSAAGHFASVCGTVIGGPHPDTGRHYTIVEPQMGGWGGAPGRDGNNAMFSAFHGETFNCPGEVAEARYGLDVDYLGFNDDEGGEGKWRGGKGMRIDYRARADDNFLTVGYSRSRILPWGLEGGNEGTANYVEVVRTTGEKSRHGFATNVRLDTGDIVRIKTANGAGYGSPKDRDPKAIQDDLLNGYITPERAKLVYGV